MAFLLRVFSRGREAPQHVEELREEFLLKKHEISQVLLQNAEVRALVEMIFDHSDQETKLFLSSPSISSLKENQDVVSRILVGLSFQDASFFGRLSGAVQEHGVETVSDVVIRVLKLLSHLLVNKHITLDDDLLDSLDYAWQLSSPLSRRPRVHFNIREQSINGQGLQPTYPFHEHDGTKKIVHCMEEAPQVSNNDNVRGQEQEPEPVKEAQNTPARAEKAEQTESSAGIEKQEERVETSDRDTGLVMIMKVGEQVPYVSGSKNACEPDEERSSSRNHSGRMSYGGSELYTTDSDDDSLSTCSHTSLLVAVSEVPDYSDSSSGDGSGLLVLEPDHVEPPVDVIFYSSSDQRNSEDVQPEQEEAFTPSEDLVVDEYNQEASSDDSAEDKLPICSSVVLSRGNSCSENDLSGESESFYTPEMWTYSDKDANDFEAALSRNLEENDTLLQSFDSNEKKTEKLEEVRVVMEASFEDKYVTVTVHPVSVQSPGDVTNRSSETGGFQEEPEKNLMVAALKVEEDGNSMLVPENRPDVKNLDNAEEDDLVELDISADGERSVEVEPDESVAETLSGALNVEQDVNFMAPENHPDIGELVEEDDPEQVELDSVENIVSLVQEEKREVAPSTVESGDSNEKDAEESEAAARTFSDTLIFLDTGESEPTAKDLDSPAVTNDYSKPDEAGTEPVVTRVIPISGPIVYNGHSGPLPYSGSLSLRSDSSTTSTRSFAFPILSAESTSSPVKMAAPERSYSRRRGRHSWRSLCCFGSVK